MCHLVYELRPDLGLDEVGGPHVADPEHQEQPPVPLADHSVPGRGGGEGYIQLTLPHSYREQSRDQPQ